MPYYDHDKDYPFAAFITNLGKYNEGELVGEWVKFPTTAEELKEVFKRIGIGQKDDFGQPYEEWFITDYDCYVDGLYSKLGEYESLDELNYLASKLDEMSESEYEQFQAGMEMGDHCGSLQEIINLTENLDCYEVYPDIHDYDDLGRYYIEELDVMQVPEHLQNYIDYEAYGRDVALEENGTFTDQGYVRDTGDSFHEYYDGERGSIPDEYRVMTFQDDLPEEEKSEWAMDIAFDMDEFFRQNDPQYAAEHPEAHAAKEEIYESLMAGRISTLDEKLAALGQTQGDYLPSEIEKFKDATGYEEFLDFDPAEIKAALENPDKSRIDEMLAFAEKAEREYAAEAAAYVQTPADIAEQAQAVPRDTFSIYQLKSGNETLDYRFEPLDAIRNNGLSVKPENYELVYTAPLTEQDSLESIYTRFNINHPADFKGHSLSVSDSQGLWNTVSCLRRKKTLTRRTVTRGNRRAKCSRTGKICVHILPRRRLRQERSGWSRTRDNRPAFKRQRRAAIRSTGCVLGLGEDTSQQAKRGNGTPVSSLVQVVCINTCPACQLFVS